MRRTLISAIAAVLIVAPAAAQQKTAAAPPAAAPIKPYKAVPVALPKPMNDPAFDAFRNQLAAAVKKRDRAAVAPLVVGKGFFWLRESGDAAAKGNKPGIDNLSTALGLGNKDAPGWDMLAGYAEDPTASESNLKKGAMCAPADPLFDGKNFNALMDETQTDLQDWAYPVEDGIEVRATPAQSAAVSEKLGMHLIRIVPDNSPAAAVAAFVRVVTPSGQAGYVAADSLAPIGNDQLCYVKEGGAWKIGGYIGGGDAQ